MSIPLSKRFALILVSICSFAVYANSLSNDFTYDDFETIVDNSFIKEVSSLRHLADRSYFSRSREDSYRPLVTASYIIDYSVWGLNPVGFHLTNLLLHTLNSLFLYLFLQRIHPSSALLATFIFTVHPVLTEAVNAVSFREDILMSLFYIISINLYLAASERPLLYIWSPVFFLLSLLSKEMALTLPLAVILIERYRGRKITWEWGYLCYIFAMVIYLYLRFYEFYNPAGGGIFSPLTLYERVSQIPAILGYYCRTLLFPINLSVEYPWQIRPLWMHFTGLVITCLSILAFLRVRGNNYSLGLLWFFITLIPALNIVPIFNPVAERYLYLPAAGGSIVLSAFLGKHDTHKPGSFILVFFAILTIIRNPVWKGDLSLWTDAVKKAPLVDRAHVALGTAYARKGVMGEAIKEYRKAIMLSPSNPEPYYGLGLAYYKNAFEEGKPREDLIWEAAALYRKALELYPSYRHARYSLAVLYHEHGKIEDAARELKELLGQHPEDYEALNRLGLAYFQKGMFREAIEQFRKGLGIDPGYVASYNNMGMVFAVMGRAEEAEKWFKKALAVNPESAETHYNLGLMYQNIGRIEDASGAYKKAMEIKPDYKEARAKLAETGDEDK